jgi:porphyrinogen peroxidase
MVTPQLGIFAIGTTSHLYLELDLRSGQDPHRLAEALGALPDPPSTMAGVHLVVGFRPELWQALRLSAVPVGLSGFSADLVGPDGYAMPATQHDLVLWFSGNSHDGVFDEARAVVRRLEPVAVLATETAGWPYRGGRDLTGFVDGSENPSLSEAPTVALVPEGAPGAGGSVLLLQNWRHEAAAWESLSREAQERVIGRTKSDSVELAPKPPDSHVLRTDQDEFGKIFRRNVPYGGVAEHGTVFVGFCARPEPLLTMLRSMVGLPDGTRDALTRYATPVSGALYFVPSADALRGLGPSPRPA